MIDQETILRDPYWSVGKRDRSGRLHRRILLSNAQSGVEYIHTLYIFEYISNHTVLFLVVRGKIGHFLYGYSPKDIHVPPEDTNKYFRQPHEK